MAGPINTTANTLESQLLEVASTLVKKELDANAANPNDDPLDNIQVVPDIEAGLVTITATLPMKTDLNGGGGLEISAEQYIDVIALG